MNFIDATQSYEAWLAKELRILPEDLEQKHQLMAKSPFPFSARHLLPLGADLGGDRGGLGQDPRGAGGGRPPR